MTPTTTGRDPQHHIELEKDDTVIALDFVNPQGKFDPLTVTQDQQPRLSIKTYQGGSTHGDYEYPYASTEQRDYSGGRGLDSRDEDETRFMDSYKCETWREGKAILGPQSHFTTGYRDADSNYFTDTDGEERTDLNWYALYDDNYMAVSFTASASYTVGYISLFLRRVGNPLDYNFDVTTTIYSNSGSDPNAVVGSSLVNISWRLDPELLSGWCTSNLLVTTTSLTQGTTYWVVIKGEGDAKNHYEIGCELASTTITRRSGDGSSWESLTTHEPYFRVVDYPDPFKAHFFEYRGALMALLARSDGSSELYISGDYGNITTSGASTIYDTSKTWTNDEHVGGVVVIVSGAGAPVDDKPRVITTNTSTGLTFTPNFNVVPSTGALYVIIGSKTWKQLLTSDLGDYVVDPVSDVLSANNAIYVAQGDYADIIRLFNPGLSDERIVSEFPAKGQYLALAPDSEGRQRIWKADNRYTANVDKAYSLVGYYSMDKLDFGLSMTDVVVNGDMEADSTWAAVLTPTTEEQSDTRASQGTYSWHLVCDAINEGIYQTLTVNSGDTYQIFASIYVESGSVTMELGGEVLATVSTTGEWIDVYGIRQVAAGTEDLEFLSNASSAEFYVDDVYTIENPTYLTNIGSGKITNLIAYDDPQRLWAATDGGLYMEDNGDMLPIPLGEFASSRDRRNGKAMLVHDVYLYLSFLDGIERYYKGNLDDVGPNRDEGLPEDRRGYVSSMVGYPGRIYAAIDIGEQPTITKYSSILLYNGVGWHEVYRHNKASDRIQSLFVQPISEDEIDRLWFSVGSDLMYVDVDLRPETNSNYRYTPESMIETGWIYYGKRDVDKYWAELKIYFDRMEDDTAEDAYIFAQYKVDEDTDWQNIGKFTQVSGETKAIGENVVGKRIKFRFALRTTDIRYTPILISAVVEFIEQVDVKDSYQIPFLVQDNKITLQGRPNFDRLEDDYDKLKEWVNNPSPVFVRSVDPRMNGKWLKPSELNSRLIKLDKQSDKTAIYCTLRMIEV